MRPATEYGEFPCSVAGCFAWCLPASALAHSKSPPHVRGQEGCGYGSIRGHSTTFGAGPLEVEPDINLVECVLLDPDVSQGFPRCGVVQQFTDQPQVSPRLEVGVIPKCFP